MQSTVKLSTKTGRAYVSSLTCFFFFNALKQLYKETTFTKAINSLFLALESINRALLLLQLFALILLQQSHFNKQN